MNYKATPFQKGFLNLLTAVLGLALLVALAFSLNALFTSRSQQSPQTASQPPSPTSQQLSPTPTDAIGQTDPTAGWKVYSDRVTGISFKYPEGWKITEVEPGRSARLINESSQYYRAIEFVIEDNPMRLPPRDFITQRLEKAYGGKLPPQLGVEHFRNANISGVRITGIPEGILSIVVVDYKGMTFRFSLIEGGEIGGAAASSFPTAREDERIFLQILDTLEGSSS